MDAPLCDTPPAGPVHAADPSVFAPLARSALFDWQREFYSSGGADSWASGAVPSWITSNAAVAQRHASVILAAWVDLLRKGRLDDDSDAGSCDDDAAMAPAWPSNPLVILELGAGSGQFAHSLLTALLQRAPLALGRNLSRRIRYIMSDGAASVVEGWARHPQLSEFATAGVLDFAVLDVQRAGWGASGISLERAQRTFRCPALAASSEVGVSVATLSASVPVIVIANYLFDSLPADVWQVLQLQNGQHVLQQGRVLLEDETSVPDGGGVIRSDSSRAQRRIKSFKANWAFFDVASSLSPASRVPVRHYVMSSPPEGRRACEAMDHVLDWYLARGCTRGLQEAFSCDWGSLPSHVRVAPVVDAGSSPAAGTALTALLARLRGASDAAVIQDRLRELLALPYSAHTSTCSATSAAGSRPLDTPTLTAEAAGTDLRDGCSSCTFLLPVGAIQCMFELQSLTSGVVKSPEGATLQRTSGPGVLLLVTDKGVLDPACYVGAGVPDIHRHGSFSTMLNFHALALTAASATGLVDATAVSLDDDVNVKTALISLSAKPSLGAVGGAQGLWADWPVASDTWITNFVQFGPADVHDLFAAVTRPCAAGPPRTRQRQYGVLANGVIGGGDLAVCSDSDSTDDTEAERCREHSPDSLCVESQALTAATSSLADGALADVHSKLSLRGAVSLCRLALWDPDVVHAVRDTFASRLASLSPPRRLSLWRGLQACARAHFLPLPFKDPAAASTAGGHVSATFPATVEVDALFDIGRILHLAGQRQAAQLWYMASIRTVDPVNVTTAFNLGLCCMRTRGQAAYAAGWFGLAVVWSGGGHASAQAWLQKATRSAAADRPAMSGASTDGCTSSDESSVSSSSGSSSRECAISVPLPPSYGRVRMFSP